MCNGVIDNSENRKKANIEIFIETIKKKCNIISHIDYVKTGRYYLIHIYFELHIIFRYLYKHNKFDHNSRIPFGRVYNDYFLTNKELLKYLDEIISKLNDLEKLYYEQTY